eukprot:COSAG05_NODE_4606_length_1440_cov_1.674124_1_plen_86_part_10
MNSPVGLVAQVLPTCTCHYVYPLTPLTAAWGVGVLSRRPGKGNDALAVANAAIETTVKVLACDQGYDGRRVRVNCLSPGMTLTGVY